MHRSVLTGASLADGNLFMGQIFKGIFGNTGFSKISKIEKMKDLREFIEQSQSRQGS